nr:cache domain-containing protein [Desulfobulbaceae bacterium]
MFAGLQIRQKIVTGSIGVLVVSMILLSLLIALKMKIYGAKEIEIFRAQQIESTKVNLKNYVDIAYRIVEAKHKEGKVDMAKELVGLIRYDNGTGYFWINDMGKPFPTMIMHPIAPTLNGKVLDDSKYNCALGKNENLFVAMASACEQFGAGFVDYLWPKPTANSVTEQQPKLSYVKLYKPLNWVIGTGVYIDDIEAMVAEKTKIVNQQISEMLLTVFGVLCLVLLIAGYLMWLMAGKISRPVLGCADFASKIGSGNYSATLEVKGADEIGLLADNLRDMAVKLEESQKRDATIIEVQQELKRGVKANADSLHEAVSDLSRMAADLAEKSQSIVEESNTVAAAAEEMSVNMASVSEAAESSQKNIDSITSATDEMTSTIEEITKNSEKARTITLEVKSCVTNAFEKIDVLGRASEEITSVVETIVEIAEQTKLLALNATIEAARAGESGKGFAVVAGEVKDLAAQTNDATQDIKRKIEAMSSSTQSTIGEIKKIGDVTNNMTTIVETIAAAVQEQSISSHNISGNISEAAQQAKEVASNVVQAATATTQIAKGVSNVNANITDIKKAVVNVNDSSVILAQVGKKLLDTIANL